VLGSVGFFALILTWVRLRVRLRFGRRKAVDGTSELQPSDTPAPKPKGRPRTVNADVKVTMNISRECEERLQHAMEVVAQSNRSEFIRAAIDSAVAAVLGASARDRRQTELPLGGAHDVVTT
jgi:hypothetical protein